MSKGFVIIGIDTDADCVKYAASLAMSIKNCDADSQVCLITDKNFKFSKKYIDLDCFDYTVELTFGNTGHKDGFHGSNFWQVMHCTPFEETIYLDYDMLFVNVDIDLLWQQFSDYEVAMPVIARTYRNDIASKTRRFEIENTYQLPTFYSQIFYFKNDKFASDWFKMADAYYHNWRSVYDIFFKDKKPESFNKNIINNLITHSMDETENVSIVLNNFYDIDVWSSNLWNEDVSEEWTGLLNNWYKDNGEIIIENSLISSGIVHYRDEKFLTKEIEDVITSTFKRNKQRQETQS